MINYWWIILIFLVGCIGPRTVRKYENIAKAYSDVGEFDNAITYYKKAYRFSKDAQYCGPISHAYTELRNYKAALEWNQLLADSMLTDSVLVSRAALYKTNGLYKKAVVQYAYISDLMSDSLFKESCDSSLRWLQSPVKVSVENLEALNSPYSDISPVVYRDGLVFSSARVLSDKSQLNPETGESFFDLYKVFKEEGEWQGIVPFSRNINSRRHEAGPCFSSDGKRIYFTRSGDRRYVKKRSKNVYHLKLYTSAKTKYGWGRSSAFFLNDSIYSFAHPTISADGKVFVFTSDMPGGYGGSDLYISFKVGQKWTKPKNLGAKVNTNRDEAYPFLSSEGMLFFSSNGHLGMGGYDLFYTKVGSGGWSIPVNLKYPVNSPQDDFGINSDGETYYFSSNRDGGLGKEDLYQIKNLIIE